MKHLLNAGLAVAALVLTAWVAVRAAGAAEAANPRPEPAAGTVQSARFKIERGAHKERAEVERQADGSIVYRVRDEGGARLELTPDQFAARLLERPGQSWWQRLFNVSSAIGLAWVCVGLLGQLLFSGRMVVQWLASERVGRSTVPTVFWWLSLGGSLLLVVYFLWRRDIVGVLGQATGCFIYVRNLVLIQRLENGLGAHSTR